MAHPPGLRRRQDRRRRRDRRPGAGPRPALSERGCGSRTTARIRENGGPGASCEPGARGCARRSGHILRITVTIVFWFVIAVFCLALEVHTNAFVALFIGVGAVISLIL